MSGCNVAIANDRNARSSGIGRNSHWSPMSKAESKKLRRVMVVDKSGNRVEVDVDEKVVLVHVAIVMPCRGMGHHKPSTRSTWS